jgi:hypothetical protein
VARARHASTGRFGLVATPGGFGTAAFGDDHAVVRVADGVLVVERGAGVARRPVHGSSLADLAALAGVDLAAPFDVGHDTPPLGDVDEPLDVDPAAARLLGSWYALGWRVLDAVAAHAAAPSRVQLWPEHFDAGCDVAVGPGPDDRCNLGASPGDGPAGTPYLYVGPWGPQRPGDAGYWNAPFGATLGYDELRSAPDPVAAGAAFLRRGVALLG